VKQTERALALIEESLERLRPELVAANAGGATVDSAPSLKFMQERLETMRANLLSCGKEGSRYKGSMTHIINDTWPTKSALGELIAEAEYQYYRII